jgi:hypothetical protein
MTDQKQTRTLELVGGPADGSRHELTTGAKYVSVPLIGFHHREALYEVDGDTVRFVEYRR